eukprot:scaffold634_cov97-Cylindrotheca_fusiformis.AAC.2
MDLLSIQNKSQELIDPVEQIFNGQKLRIFCRKKSVRQGSREREPFDRIVVGCIDNNNQKHVIHTLSGRKSTK